MNWRLFFCIVLAILAALFVWEHRAAGAVPYVENATLAAKLIRVTAGLPGAVLKADCRSINLKGVGAALVASDSECLVVARNGKGKPIWCGILDVNQADVKIVAAQAYPCAVVKHGLAKIGPRHVRSAASSSTSAFSA